LEPLTRRRENHLGRLLMRVGDRKLLSAVLVVDIDERVVGQCQILGSLVDPGRGLAACSKGRASGMRKRPPRSL
jgi:hypothetical protein